MHERKWLFTSTSRETALRLNWHPCPLKKKKLWRSSSIRQKEGVSSLWLIQRIYYQGKSFAENGATKLVGTSPVLPETNCWKHSQKFEKWVFTISRHWHGHVCVSGNYSRTNKIRKQKITRLGSKIAQYNYRKYYPLYGSLNTHWCTLLAFILATLSFRNSNNIQISFSL